MYYILKHPFSTLCRPWYFQTKQIPTFNRKNKEKNNHLTVSYDGRPQNKIKSLFTSLTKHKPTSYIRGKFAWCSKMPRLWLLLYMPWLKSKSPAWISLPCFKPIKPNDSRNVSTWIYHRLKSSYFPSRRHLLPLPSQAIGSPILPASVWWTCQALVFTSLFSVKACIISLFGFLKNSLPGLPASSLRPLYSTFNTLTKIVFLKSYPITLPQCLKRFLCTKGSSSSSLAW